MSRRWNRFVPCFIIFIMAALPVQAVEPDAPLHVIDTSEAEVINLRVKLARLKRPTQPADYYEINGLDNFYRTHPNSLIWFDGNFLNPKAKKVLAVLQNALSWGLDPNHFKLPKDLANGTFAAYSQESKINAELQISLAILRYVRYASGGQVDPSRISLDFDRRPLLADPSEVFSSITSYHNPKIYLESFHPQHRQFQLLRKIYLDLIYGSQAKSTSQQSTLVAKRKLSKNEKKLLKRLRVNMEMWRWMPRDLGDRYIWANIPEYNVRVFDNGQSIYQERIVVGKTKNKTPIFSDEMETIVFQPYWYVPNSIKVKELLPRLLKGSSTGRLKIAAKIGGREINPDSVDWHRKDIRKYVVYQPPGRRNALGEVKFLFPNKHAVYFHDTPKKHLFKRKRRAYSHGCMRVRRPLEFARVLLAKDRGWSKSRIKYLARRGPENNTIKLRRKIPVHVTYFTMWVGNNGKLKVFKDIYQHERLIAKGLNGDIKSVAPPKPEDLGKTRLQILAGRSAYSARRLSASQRRARRRATRYTYAPYAENYGYSISMQSRRTR